MGKKNIRTLEQALNRCRKEHQALLAEHREMQKSANELVSAQAQIQSVLNNASEGIIMFSSDDTVLSFNRAAERIFACAEVEVLYRKIDTLFNAPEGQSVPQLIRDYCAAHLFTDMIDEPLMAVRPSGELVPLRAAMSEVNSFDMILFDDEGTLDKNADPDYDLFFCIVHDLSDDIQIKNTLKAQQEALTHANQIKDHLIANVSHELLTPLNGILPLTELLLDDALTQEQNDYIHIIQDSSRALKRIVSSILQFSQAQQPMSTASSQSVMLSDVCQQLEDHYQQRLKEKGLTLTCVNEVLTLVYLDSNRLLDVLDRLLDNAVKFTQHGQIVLQINVNASVLRFSIRDTGCGIENQRLPVIFQSFVQEDGSKTRAYGGVGLGLAIAEQFVGEMGGRIWADSQVGIGSCFQFEIPLQTAKPAASDTIDDAVFRELQALLGGCFQEVVQGYTEETSTRLEKLGLILEDEASVRGVLNDICAGSHQMGALEMAKLCEDLKGHMVDLSLEALQDKLACIQAAFLQVKHDLAARCQRG